MSTATTVSVATTATTAASQSTCTATISLEATDTVNSNGCPTTEQCYGQWLAWMHGHPVALMLLQYTTAASHAATHYIFSAIWTLTQSLVILLTVQSLEWIQSLGPMLLSWDIFLPGALFLTMNINPELLDGETHPEALIPLPIHRGSGSGSSRSSRSSSTTGNKKVTFHEQVMVLGRSAAMAQQQQQQQRHDLSLDSNGGNHYRSSKIDASLPLVESPTRSEFSMDDGLSLDHKRTVLAMMRQEEAAYHCSVNDNLSDCGSSRSNSCRSSICSVDSNDSREVRKASSSSRLANLFHPRRQQQQLTPPPSRPCSPVAAQADLAFDAMASANTAAAGWASMTTMAMHTSVPPPPHHKHPLVHRIMHPHQHKREVQQMHQSEAQSRSSLESDSWSISSHEYQPELGQQRKTSKGSKTGKTLGERLGLKKKRTVQI